MPDPGHDPLHQLQHVGPQGSPFAPPPNTAHLWAYSACWTQTQAMPFAAPLHQQQPVAPHNLEPSFPVGGSFCPPDQLGWLGAGVAAKALSACLAREVPCLPASCPCIRWNGM